MQAEIESYLECVLPFWSKHLRCISKPAKMHKTYQLFSVGTDLHGRIEGARRNLEHSFGDLQVGREKLEENTDEYRFQVEGCNHDTKSRMQKLKLLMQMLLENSFLLFMMLCYATMMDSQ